MRLLSRLMRFKGSLVDLITYLAKCDLYCEASLLLLNQGPYSLSLLESKIDPVLDSRLRLGLKAQKMVFTKLFES